jgi:hypothetical protein
MADLNQEALRQALGLAVSILEDLPAHLRPARNMEDMRQLLAGRTSDRGGIIVMEAVSTALAFRTFNAMTYPIEFHNKMGLHGKDRQDLAARSDRLNSRTQEFGALFALLATFDPYAMGSYYLEACSRLAAIDRAPPLTDTPGGAP